MTAKHGIGYKMLSRLLNEFLVRQKQGSLTTTRRRNTWDLFCGNFPVKKEYKGNLKKFSTSMNLCFSPFALQQTKEKNEVWKCIWEEKDRLKKTVRMDAVTFLYVCDKSTSPVVHRFLQNLALQFVFTASAERSFSCLRRLKSG